MARNGSGTYSKVNTFVAGNSITASGHNQNWDDLVTEMTNSVAADGQTTMTGALKGYAGTVSLPGYAFSSDLDCGMYRIGANNIGLAVAGAKVIDIATTGAAITGTLSSTGAFTATGALTASSTADVTGNFNVNTNKFSVTAASGNTSVAGTLGVTGATTLSSTLAVTSDVAVNTNKFTITASTGNTVVAGTLAVTGVATLSGGVAGLIAAQSDQETATSTTLAVSPGRQQYHPSAAKCWIYVDSAGTTLSSYNITSTTDGGTGSVTITIATDFSSAAYGTAACAISDGSVFAQTGATGYAAGSYVLQTRTSNTGSFVDSGNLAAASFGDQA